MSTWGIATCRRDGAPLIETFAWSKFEFYCLDCGGHFDLLQPVGTPETSATLARLAVYQAEWDTLSVGIVGAGVMLTSCIKCGRYGTHEQHWTQTEQDADAEARARLAARITIGG